MEPFIHTYTKDSGTMELVLTNQTPQDNYEELIRFYQRQLAQGVRYFDVDLRQIDFINSLGIGVLVAFNTTVAHRGGRLRLILGRTSKICDLIQLCKLDRIIDVVLL